jgi:hypothetical protein
MHEARLRRFTIWISAIALLVVYAIMIPMKLHGELTSHFTWLKLLIGPPIMLSILPIVVFRGTRSTAS